MKGVRYARAHVSELPVVVGIRELRAFGLFHPAQQLRLEDTETRSVPLATALWVLWLPVLLLGTYGFIRIARSIGRAALPLFATVAAAVFTVAISYGNQRLRTICEPSFLVATAVALANLPLLPQPEPPTNRHRCGLTAGIAPAATATYNRSGGSGSDGPQRNADRRQRQADARPDALRNHARILEAAERVFALEGAAVPIDDVAREAGVGVGATVYRHFPTKEDLCQAVVIAQ